MEIGPVSGTGRPQMAVACLMETQASCWLAKLLCWDCVQRVGATVCKARAPPLRRRPRCCCFGWACPMLMKASGPCPGLRDLRRAEMGEGHRYGSSQPRTLADGHSANWTLLTRKSNSQREGRSVKASRLERHPTRKGRWPWTSRAQPADQRGVRSAGEDRHQRSPMRCCRCSSRL